MALSNDLISQFAKITNDNKKVKTEKTVYGTAVVYDGAMYVKLDGSDLLTPYTTTAEVKDGDRVAVVIKNHTATVTGNLTSPAARIGSVEEVNGKVNIVIDGLEATNGYIKNLETENLRVNEKLTAAEGNIDKLAAKDVAIEGTLTAQKGVIENLKTAKLDAAVADITFATIENLYATNANIHNLEADYGDFKKLTVDDLEAQKATIDDLDVKKLDADWANIDSTNIDIARIGELFAKSGIITELTTETGTITGRLVGVHISGDLIDAHTMVADRLMIQGEDGLYYQLNIHACGGELVRYEVTYNAETGEYTSTDNVVDLEIVEDVPVENATTPNNEQIYSTIINDETIYYYKTYVYENEDGETQGVPKDGLHGKNIVAESITADKLKVSDLQAFGANIAGFKMILDNDTGVGAIYSVGKDTVKSTVKGSYLDSEGQISIGDQNSYVRYYKLVDPDGAEILDDNGNPIYKLEISADSVVFGSSRRTAEELADLADHIKIGTYKDPDTEQYKPSVELTEDGTSDKLLMTNEKVILMDGENEGTVIDKKKVVTSEVRQGNFAWIGHGNGNYGLTWKGAIS